jgi:orotidine-5'-phosphate decarboxylase
MMEGAMIQLSARERIILSIDTSGREDAERLAAVAQQAGARLVKMGLELSSATSWSYCSELAERHGLGWVADAKLDDIPHTVAGKGTQDSGGTVKNIAGLAHPPFGITIHTTAGLEAMRKAQQVAGDVKMLGVTVLTSISDEECYAMYGPVFDPEQPPSAHRMSAFRRATVMRLARSAARAGLAGFVSSPLEVSMIKSDPETQGLFAMIPGTRSEGVDHGDQSRVATPGEAIEDGADLLVIGRQITQAENPAAAYQALVTEIEAAQQ